MTTFLILLLIAAMGATAYVLVRGVIAMANGKDVSGAQQQNYMQKRVLFQGIAIMIICAILLVARD
ncbi:HIG1 domain-containing protein [Sphingomicrobium arenosum]|uniref:HIG1 domain-containing protein n=1 Tax=Sphingomicrobium arenosum TaxID=2233861 RepID=UPI002241030B|nr:HIG1 domain-containing protein [Sphingomicrobium arenosum]